MTAPSPPAPPHPATARRRRTLPRGLRPVLLTLLALLAPVVAAGAQTVAATGAVAATAQAGTLAPVPLTAPRGFEAALAAELAGVADANRQAEELAQQEKEVVAEAERITKEAAAIEDGKAALNARVAEVNQEISSHNERAQAVAGEIAAHNARQGTAGSAGEVAAFNAEADRLDARRDQENAVEDRIQGEESQIQQEADRIDARSSQLDSAARANDGKAADLKSKEQQLQSRKQQLLAQMAQVVQSFAAVPSNPATAMDQGGDAPAPTPQAGNRLTGQDEDTGDRPYRRPQAAALTQYAEQHGTTVDPRPGTAYLTPDAVRRLSPAQAAALGSPAVGYDGLVRKPDGHYTALRVRAPSAAAPSPSDAPSPATVAFGSGGLVVHLDGAQLPVDEVTTVEEAPAPGEDADRRVPTCKDLKPAGAVDLNGGGWVDYLPSDAQGRNRGVRSCLQGTPDRKRGEEASKAGNIRGWTAALARAAALGFTASENAVARCHSVPSLAGGTADERNLTPCFQLGANINQATGGTITNSMRSFERIAESRMPQGYVLYDVRPEYDDARSTIPWAWDMSLDAWDAATGAGTGPESTVVENARYGPTGLVNLGK